MQHFICNCKYLNVGSLRKMLKSFLKIYKNAVNNKRKTPFSFFFFFRKTPFRLI